MCDGHLGQGEEGENGINNGELLAPIIEFIAQGIFPAWGLGVVLEVNGCIGTNTVHVAHNNEINSRGEPHGVINRSQCFVIIRVKIDNEHAKMNPVFGERGKNKVKSTNNPSGEDGNGLVHDNEGGAPRIGVLNIRREFSKRNEGGTPCDGFRRGQE